MRRFAVAFAFAAFIVFIGTAGVRCLAGSHCALAGAAPESFLTAPRTCSARAMTASGETCRMQA